MSYSSEVLADSPTLYWRLGETSGTTAADSSGNGHTGTYQNGVSLGVTGLIVNDSNKAAAFEFGNFAVNDTRVISTGTFSGPSSAYTIEVCFKWNGDFPTNFAFVAGFEQSNPNFGPPQISMWPSASTLYGWNTFYVLPGGFVPGTSYHVMVTDDGVTETLYLNGHIVNTTSTGIPHSYTANFTVGSDGFSTPDEGFSGTIDEVSIYPTALSASRVTVHYVAAFNRIEADADVTMGTGSAQSPSESVATGGTGVASGTGTIPQVNTSTFWFAYAGLALGTGTGNNATTKNPIDKPTAGVATGTGRAFDKAGGGFAGLAHGVGTASLPVPTQTISLALATITTAALDSTTSQPTVPAPTPAGQQTNYSLVSVDQDGTRHAEFPLAFISQVTWELNAPGEATFTIGIDDPNIVQLPLAKEGLVPVREVQIWRNGHLMWWGIPTKRRMNSGTRQWEYTAEGLLWYFTKRYVGDANRGNFLENPSAELSTADWSTFHATLSASTEQHILGDHSFKVVGDGSATSFIFNQRIIHGTSIGLALFLSAWFYIDAATYTEGEPSQQAFSCQLYRSDPVTLAIKEMRYADQPLNDATPKNRWIRTGTHIWIPPNETDIISVFLYSAPGASVYWDALQLVAQDSVAFGGPPPQDGPFDQVSIAKILVQYAQGKSGFAYDSTGQHNAKSWLNIGTAGALSGVNQQRFYEHSAHQQIYSGGSGSGALDEWPQRVNGFDFSIEITPTTRTFTTWYPQRGTTRTDLTLEWGRNIASYDIEEDISDAANQIVVLGDSSGGSFDSHDTSREEGGYSNPSSLGGLTLEYVESAPAGAPIDTLDNIARVRGAQKEKGSTIPSVTVIDGRDDAGNVVAPVIGLLNPGDVVPVRIIDGDLSFQENFRVVQLSLDPQTDQMQVSLNKEAAGQPS